MNSESKGGTVSGGGATSSVAAGGGAAGSLEAGSAAIPNPGLNVLGRKIAFSTLVQYAGKLIQMGLAMLTLKLISNFLSAGDYGAYAKVTEFALFFSTMANLGIFGNLVRVMADRPRDGAVFFNALVLRLLTAAAFFIPALAYLVLSGGMVGAGGLGAGGQVFLYGSVLFFGALLFDFITSVCDGMLQANYMMGRATLALVSGRIVNYALTLALIKAVLVSGSAESVFMLFAATFAGSIVTAALSIFFVRSRIDWSWNLNKSLIAKLFLAGLPFGIINIINNLYFRFLPDLFAQNALTEAQFGSFNVSFRIAQVASLFSTFLMFSVLPGFKEYIDAGHFHKARQLFGRVWKILLTAGVLLVAGGSLFGGVAIELLTHKKFILPELWFVLPLMLLLAAISYGYDLVLIILFALEEDLWFLKMEFIALAVSGGIFLSTFLVEEPLTKMLLILLAAIYGETFMVVNGSLRVRKSLAKRGP